VKKILLTKFKSLGDVILITPLIKNLKLAFPESDIDIMLKSGTEKILSNNPHIHQIFCLKKNKRSFLNFLGNIFLYLKIRRNKYDLLITTDGGESSSILARVSKAKIKIGRRNYMSPNLDNYFTHFFGFHGERHVIDLNLDPLLILDKKISSMGLEVFPLMSDFDKVRNFLTNEKVFIHIHPCSQCDYKLIDNRLMAKIIDFCEINLGIKTVITGFGSNDDKLVSKILDYTNSQPINLCSKLTLMETAALNKMAHALVVVDTAIMHISTANETPVIAFFGPTAVNNWGPWDKNLKLNTYHRLGGVQKHGIHTVIARNFECIPCSKNGCNNSGFSECLYKINFNQIKSEIETILKGKNID